MTTSMVELGMATVAVEPGMATVTVGRGMTSLPGRLRPGTCEGAAFGVICRHANHQPAVCSASPACSRSGWKWIFGNRSWASRTS